MTIYLPPKFDQHIINNFQGEPLTSSILTVREKLDSIYSQENVLEDTSSSVFSPKFGFEAITTSKTHVVTHPDMPEWVFKYKRCDEDRDPDSHIYRVRKAHKIKKMQLPNIVVPEKFLYKLPNNEYIVLSQKMKLETEKTTVFDGSRFTERKKLTPSQGWNIVHIIFRANALDLTSSNIDFDENNNVVLPDTEPTYRDWRKKAWRWIPGASITFCHIIGVLITQTFSARETRSTKIAIHAKKTLELGRLLIQLGIKAGLPLLLSKGFTYLAISTGSALLLGASPIIASAATVSLVGLSILGGLAVTAHIALPFLI